MNKRLILVIFNLITSMTIYGQDTEKEEVNGGAEFLKFLKTINEKGYKTGTYVSSHTPSANPPTSYQSGAAPTGHQAPEGDYKKKQPGCFPFSFCLRKKCWDSK